MKLCGIIAEFNPFTNGHEYFISEIKKQTNAEIVAIMSGDFSQRGEMTILGKYDRASLGIKNGVSICAELPACFALSSAEYFAFGAVKILADVGIEELAFGVKTKNIFLLKKIAKFKSENHPLFSSHLKSLIKAGLSYSRAFYQTFHSLFPQISNELDEIFNEPNNILAIEYLSAIYSMGLNITPIFINRQDSGYNTNKIKCVSLENRKQKMVNATYIRSLVLNGKLRKIKSLVPSLTFHKLKKCDIDNLKTANERLDAILLSKIQNFDNKDLSEFASYNIGLSHLVLESSKNCFSREEICKELESKCYRKTRINLEKPYAINVLAVSKLKRELLSKLIKTSKAKLIVSVSDRQKLEQNLSYFTAINQKASNLYNIANKLPYALDKTLFI